MPFMKKSAIKDHDEADKPEFEHPNKDNHVYEAHDYQSDMLDDF